MVRCRSLVGLLVPALLPAGPLAAQARDTTRAQVVDTLEVVGRADDLIGLAAGASWTPGRQGPFCAVRLRHLGAYPLVEGNRVRATASTLVNAEAGWLLGSGIRLQLSVLNLLDARAYDIQYYYTSRLPGEPAEGVDDIHVHPTEPRQVRVSFGWGL